METKVIFGACSGELLKSRLAWARSIRIKENDKSGDAGPRSDGGGGDGDGGGGDSD
jgi:hypothetical protein